MISAQNSRWVFVCGGGGWSQIIQQEYSAEKIPKIKPFHQQRRKVFRAVLKVTVMSVDTDKGIDDLPPDADTIRDRTHTVFSWRKNPFYFLFYGSLFR
jgi:hypothetical protein